jgi:hypothetical protein
VNSVTAILLVAFLLTIWSVISSRDVKELLMFPWCIWAAAIFVGPFSFLTGLVAMTLLTRVRHHSPGVPRYVAEATILGGLLGASYPAIAAILRLNLVNWGILGFGILSGAACGLIVGSLSIRRVPERNGRLGTQSDCEN